MFTTCRTGVNQRASVWSGECQKCDGKQNLLECLIAWRRYLHKLAPSECGESSAIWIITIFDRLIWFDKTPVVIDLRKFQIQSGVCLTFELPPVANYQLSKPPVCQTVNNSVSCKSVYDRQKLAQEMQMSRTVSINRVRPKCWRTAAELLPHVRTVNHFRVSSRQQNEPHCPKTISWVVCGKYEWQTALTSSAFCKRPTRRDRKRGLGLGATMSRRSVST